MATHKIDLFHDGVREVFRKHGIDDPADKAANLGLANAFGDMMEEVEAAFEAAEKAKVCDHCGAVVTRLRLSNGAQLALCSLCRDGLSYPKAGG